MIITQTVLVFLYAPVCYGMSRKSHPISRWPPKGSRYDYNNAEQGCGRVWEDTYEPYLSLYEQSTALGNHNIKTSHWPPPNWVPGIFILLKG